MRPSRETVVQQFKDIFDAKKEEWKKKHIQPEPPTVKALKEDLAAGRVKIDTRCACKVMRRNNFEYSAPDRDDFIASNMFRVPCVEAYLKAASKHFADWSAFHSSLKEVRNEAQNDVLYAKVDFNQALEKLRAFKVR